VDLLRRKKIEKNQQKIPQPEDIWWWKKSQKNKEKHKTSFDSCHLFNKHLRLYQKKSRFFIFRTSSIVAATLVVATVLQITFFGDSAQGATYHFQQLSWLMQTANVANHSSNQSNWSEYQTKDVGVMSVNGGNDIQLIQQSNSLVQTSDADFNAADSVKSNTAVSGTANAASVTLANDFHTNEYTVGHLSDINVGVTAVGSTSPFLLTLSGTPDLSRIFKNDLFVDAAGKKWKVLSLNPSPASPRLLVVDSEGNGTSPTTGSGSVGRWFPDLAAWNAARVGDIVSRNAIERALPYYDVSPDVNPLEINGWITDATHYVEINVPLSERHEGKWDDGRYRMVVSGNNVVSISNPNVKIFGLQLDQTSGDDNRNGIDYVSNDNIELGYNIIRRTGTGTLGAGVRADTSNNTKVYNNIIYDFSSANSKGIWLSGSNGTNYIFNNTVFNSNDCYDLGNNNAKIINNIAQNCSVGFDPASSVKAGSSNNLSNLADALGANPQNSKTVIFKNSAGKDFHLEFNDAAAKNVGIDLSADLNLSIDIDIDKEERLGTWDIGADDAGATFIHTSSIGTSSRDFATLQNWENARGGLLTTRNVFKITSQTGAFVENETITGLTSGKSGSYVKNQDTPSASQDYLFLDGVSGTFIVGEMLSGSISGKTATLSSIITITGTIEKSEAYKDSLYTKVLIDGSTTDVDHFMWLTAEVRSRHQGISGTGVKITTAEAGDINIVGVADLYSRFDWFEIGDWVDGRNYAVHVGSQGANSQISNLLVYGNPDDNVPNSWPVDINNATAFNNVVYGTWGGIYVTEATAFNNTVYNTKTGFFGFGTGNTMTNVYLDNNISFNNAGGDYQTSAESFDDILYTGRNISSDGTALSTGFPANVENQANRSLADIKFVSTDASLIDLHIMNGSVAKDAAFNLSFISKNDLDGQRRPSGADEWDIGADEWFSTSPTSYKTSGTFESGVVDLQVKPVFTTLDFTQTLNGGTARYQLATADVSTGPWDYIGPDGSAATFFTTSGTATSSNLNGKRYLRYKAIMQTSDTSKTPKLNDLTLNYASYPASAELVSSPYDTTDGKNILSKLRWTENLVANSDISFQIRTSPDGSNWTSWLGPDGTSSTEFTDPIGGETIPAIFQDGINNQFFQYKAILHSDGTVTPTLSDTEITYIVNAPPQIQNVTALQNADGSVSVNYQVKDPDTTTGILNGFVNTALQYCTANCTNAGSETWENAVTTSGGLGSVAVLQDDFTSYSALWTAKSDYDNQYDTDMKMRIIVNDGEEANNFAYGSSNNFALDTKAPTNVSIAIDARTKDLIFSTPVDNSTYQMAVSNYVDFHDATLEPFVDNKNWPTLSADPATVYFKVADSKGNTTSTSATTPQKPKNIVYFDVSDASIDEYRELIVWSVADSSEVGAGFASYGVERKENLGTFSYLGMQPNQTSNFYMDNAVNNSTLYSYRAYVQDIAGNKSAYSDVVSDTPSGQGGSDTTAPVITNASIQTLTPTTATIVWTTDEMSDSSVGYSQDTTYLSEQGVSSMVMNHSVTITNLIPETQYYIKIKSRDPLNNQGEVDGANPGANPVENFLFTTLPGPQVSGVTVTEINDSDATIEWQTDIDADSEIDFSMSLSNGELLNHQAVTESTLLKNHILKIQNLTPDARYYFSVTSKDNANNKTTDKNGGTFFELLTTQDLVPPQIQNLSTTYASSNAAVITFTTNEPAKVKISYGKTSKNIFQDVTTFDRSHTLFLSELTADKNYIYDIEATDINANSITSSQQTFKTEKDQEFIHPPLSEIIFADPNPSIVNDKVAVISFSTDQNAKCLVEYGNQAGTYDAIPVAEKTFNNTHGIQLNGLLFQTKYFYRVICRDNLDNMVSSEELFFTTQGQLFTQPTAIENHNPPTISNVSVADVTGESATVTWDTDEKTSSGVRFGIANVDENMFSDSIASKNVSEYVTKHSVLVPGLVPATKYIFVVTSVDASGYIASSSESSFTTASPSSISSIKAISTDLGEATITWQTNPATSSIVEYGLTTSYGEIKESSTQTKSHQINLSSLNQNTVYHYRVRGKDDSGRLYASSDNTFEPKSPPQIADVSINDISEHEAKVSFVTNVPTTANIFYTNVQDAADNGAQASLSLASSHKLQLKNLSQGKTFSVKIVVTDEQGTGNEMNAPDITTGKDENPPRIENVKTDSALTQSNKVQTIISWKTDEQGSTSIIYKEGSKGEVKEIRISGNLTTEHVGVLTFFKPGTVYNFRVKSVDASGNESISGAYAFLTPRKDENIIQIIINNFMEIFGWARK